MNFRIVRAIYAKEVLDTLRDRRALISMIIVPLVAMPGIFGVVRYFTENLGKKAQEESTRIGASARVTQAPIREALKTAGFELMPVSNPRTAVESKSVAAALDEDRGPANEDRVVIFVDRTRQASSMAAEKITSALERLRLDQVKGNLRGLGVSERVLNPFSVTSSNVAPEKKMAGFILGGVLGYSVLLLMFTGGMYPAIDMTAGEKERHTLEPLLASPASREEIILGKILTTTTASFMTALLTIGSLLVSMQGSWTRRGRDGKSGEPRRSRRRHGDACAIDAATHGAFRGFRDDRHRALRPRV
jgi:sodium transport system permease protein